MRPRSRSRLLPSARRHVGEWISTFSSAVRLNLEVLGQGHFTGMTEPCRSKLSQHDFTPFFGPLHTRGNTLHVPQASSLQPHRTDITAADQATIAKGHIEEVWVQRSPRQQGRRREFRPPFFPRWLKTRRSSLHPTRLLGNRSGQGRQPHRQKP